MLRAPIWTMSAASATDSTSLGVITSVITGRPVWRRASARWRSPARPSPWKAYGEVRGLKAPPLRMWPPASRTARAVSSSISSFSTLHGPAISTTSSPPMVRPLARVITVSERRNSRPLSLYGRVIRTTSSTDWSWVKASFTEKGSWPITPMTVRSSPSLRWVFRPRASTLPQTRSMSALLAPDFITMIMGGPRRAAGRARRWRARGAGRLGRAPTPP